MGSYNSPYHKPMSMFDPSKNPGLIWEAPSTNLALAAAFPASLGAEAVPDFEIPRLARKCNSQVYGSCVGEATERMVEYYNRDENDLVQLSARDVYSQCKLIDNYPYQGTYFSVAMDVVKKLGVVAESLHPNDFSSYERYVKPYPDRIPAQPYRSKGYVLLQNPEEAFRFAYTAMKPVLMGVNGNNQSWTNQTVRANNNTVVQWNSDLGGNWGHAVLLVGKKTINGKVHLILENSWDDWVDSGRALLGRDYNGLQYGFYGLYDLPNNWKDINNDYKETHMTLPQLNAIQYSVFRTFLGRNPKAEEIASVQNRNSIWLAALNKGGEAGQADLDKEMLSFRPENKTAVQTGKI